MIRWILKRESCKKLICNFRRESLSVASATSPLNSTTVWTGDHWSESSAPSTFLSKTTFVMPLYFWLIRQPAKHVSINCFLNCRYFHYTNHYRKLKQADEKPENLLPKVQTLTSSILMMSQWQWQWQGGGGEEGKTKHWATGVEIKDGQAEANLQGGHQVKTWEHFERAIWLGSDFRNLWLTQDETVIQSWFMVELLIGYLGYCCCYCCRYTVPPLGSRRWLLRAGNILPFWNCVANQTSLVYCHLCNCCYKQVILTLQCGSPPQINRDLHHPLFHQDQSHHHLPAEMESVEKN